MIPGNRCALLLNDALLATALAFLLQQLMTAMIWVVLVCSAVVLVCSGTSVQLISLWCADWMKLLCALSS